MRSHECSICAKPLSSRKSLRRHIRRTHPESEEASDKHTSIVKGNSVVCPLCRATLSQYQALVAHLTEAHDLPMNEEAHDFLSINDFLKWKQEVEKVTESRFVKMRGTAAVKCVRGTKDVYVCHRSGRHRGKEGERVRQLKSQGSQKLDAFCPARMKVVTTEGGRVFINFLPTHVGHGTDPAHLRLSRSEKEMLAKKMADKRPFDDILQEIRESSEPLGRLKLLSKQDLHNISRDVKLLTSVYSGSNIADWVDHQRQNGLVLWYKPSGVQHESDALSAEDFVLCLLNLPKDLPTEFISLDSFETPSAYEFNLFSISAADDIASPISVLISNRNDLTILEMFLEKVKSSLNMDISPCYLFHSRNSQFYHAWRTHFGEPRTQNVGSWQLEQELRQNLSKMVQNKLKKVEIYKAFRSLMEIPNEEDFTTMCNNILCKVANNESESFKSYFGEILSCHESWAKFQRTPKLSEINGIFERLHRTLHSVHSRYKLKETLGLLASSIVETMNYRSNGESRKALKDIKARHKAAMKTECTITLEAENLWKVLFQGTREASCTVEKGDFSCQCQLKCEECKFCLHAFICTCADFTSRGNMCKHVHSICMSLFSDKEMTIEEGFEELEPEPFEVIISEAVTSEEVEDGKLELQQDFSRILSMIRTVEDVNLVQNAFRLITSSLGVNKGGGLPLNKGVRNEK